MIGRRLDLSAMRIFATLGFALCVTVGTARAEVQSASEPVGPLAAHELLQHISSGGYPPSVPMALDNNGAILLACREPRSAQELRADGLAFADSQVDLLVVANLLGRDGSGRLRTLFPILDENATSELRDEAKRLAEQLAPLVREDTERLVQALEAEGHENRAFTVLLSYVLDGMVWGFFEEYKLVFPRRLTARTPFWSGDVWALRPKRGFRPITRSITAGAITLRVTSLSETGGAEDLFADPAVVKSGMKQFETEGRVGEGAARELFARFGLVDESGSWTVPVIDEVEKGPSFRAAETLTSDLVDAIVERADLETLQEKFGFRNPQQTLVIFYHEFLWEMLEFFEKAGLVSRPAALGSTADFDPSTVGSAALVTDRRRPVDPERFDEPKHDSLDGRGAEGSR